MWENQNAMWENQNAICENQNAMWENQNTMWENRNAMWKNQNTMREGIPCDSARSFFVRHGKNDVRYVQNTWRGKNALQDIYIKLLRKQDGKNSIRPWFLYIHTFKNTYSNCHVLLSGIRNTYSLIDP